MSTQYYSLEGTFKWAKVRKPDPKYDNYSIDVYPSNITCQEFLDITGLSLVPKTDADGEYLRFRRPNKKLIKNEVAEFGPPQVNGADQKLIGNGSKGVVDIVVYDTVKGKGHRLNTVHVYDLVEYQPNPHHDEISKPIGSDVPFTKQTLPKETGADGLPKTTKKRPF